MRALGKGPFAQRDEGVEHPLVAGAVVLTRRRATDGLEQRGDRGHGDRVTERLESHPTPAGEGSQAPLGANARMVRLQLRRVECSGPGRDPAREGPGVHPRGHGHQLGLAALGERASHGLRAPGAQVGQHLRVLHPDGPVRDRTFRHRELSQPFGEPDLALSGAPATLPGPPPPAHKVAVPGSRPSPVLGVRAQEPAAGQRELLGSAVDPGDHLFPQVQVPLARDRCGQGQRLGGVDRRQHELARCRRALAGRHRTRPTHRTPTPHRHSGIERLYQRPPRYTPRPTTATPCPLPVDEGPRELRPRRRARPRTTRTRAFRPA